MRYFQSFCKAIGNYGCYVLCIIDIAEEITGKKFNPIQVMEDCITKGFVYFDKSNYDNKDNFFVKEPHKVLEMLTNRKFTITKESSDYKAKKDEYVIEFWSTNGLDGHFARINKDFNSLQKSRNVNSGRIHSYRVFREVK